jgi:hypothetical protein
MFTEAASAQKTFTGTFSPPGASEWMKNGRTNIRPKNPRMKNPAIIEPPVPENASERRFRKYSPHTTVRYSENRKHFLKTPLRRLIFHQERGDQDRAGNEKEDERIQYRDNHHDR